MSPLDLELERRAEQLFALPSNLIAAFFACCAERRLRLYEEFSTKWHWGDPIAVAQTADRVWRALSDPHASQDLAAASRELERNTPRSDDFDNVEAVFAQSAIVCIDASLHALVDRQHPGVHWFQCTIQPLRAAAYLRETGYMDSGGLPAAQEVDRQLLADPHIRREFSFQDEDTADMATVRALTPEYCNRLRDRAFINRWTTSTLLSSS